MEFELKHCTPDACASPSGSSGWFTLCLSPYTVGTFGTGDTRCIAQVNVSCGCNTPPVATISCGEDEVAFTCGLMDQFIMGLSLHGWRVQPYVP